MEISVRGKIIKEVYKNKEFRILSFSPNSDEIKKVKINKYGTISLKGELGFLTVGDEYELKLEEADSSMYGTSYTVISCPSLMELDLSELTIEKSKDILRSFTTERQANNILEAYPNFIAKIINEGKESIDISKIYGVGEAYLNAYARELNERYKYLHILNKYVDYKVTISDCKKLYENYATDSEIETNMEEQPYYVLMEILGRSFESTDKLILEKKPELTESEQRCEAMCIDVLRRNEVSGSTKMNAKDLWNYAHEYDNRLLNMIKDVCINSDKIFYDENKKEVAVMATYLGELRVSEFVKEKLANSRELDLDWKSYQTVDDFSLTDTQLKSLENFCKYNISILCGFSGSGKSASIKNLVKMMDDNKMTYTLLSPTGKASRVLAESTNRSAFTIHKKCYEGNIDSDVIIVDEFGMVSLDVMCMLLNSITNTNARIVFVGDPAQLSSIGLGKLFDDFIKSEIIPTTTLTEIFRYKSNGSLFVATNVRNGKAFFSDDEMVKVSGNTYSVCNNYKFIETEDIMENVLREYNKLLSKGIKQKDIMVLSPMNIRDMGTYNINNRIQEEVNPPKANEKLLTRKIDYNTIKFRVGDIVLNTKNDYNAVSYDAYLQMKEDSLLTDEDVADKVIINGQTGIIREIIEKEGMIVQFDEDLIFVSKSKLNQMLLGYSISTFKAQGSTVDYVINIVSDTQAHMLNRGLLYVADTRNRKSCVDIGNVSAYEKALNVVTNDLRKTFLLEMLTQNVEKDLTN